MKLVRPCVGAVIVALAGCAATGRAPACAPTGSELGPPARTQAQVESRKPTSIPARNAARNPAADRAALIALENRWLHARTPATLARLLAPGFVHPIAAGVFVTRAEQLAWFRRRKKPPGRRHLDHLEVRLFGDVGIVNGVVVTARSDGGVHRTLFTDVFVYRDGRWQAVNAQENAVVPAPAGDHGRGAGAAGRPGRTTSD